MHGQGRRIRPGAGPDTGLRTPRGALWRRKRQKYGDFIEALVSQILELGVKEPTARAALERLRAEYVDWNDMRVATVREIEDILGARYFRCREKAEDVKHLLADL